MATKKRVVRKKRASKASKESSPKRHFTALRSASKGKDSGANDSVVIGSASGDYYFVRERNGKYYAGDPDDGNELPVIPADGVPVLETLTRRGSLVAHISSDDAPGLGSYCYLISIDNLKRTGLKKPR